MPDLLAQRLWVLERPGPQRPHEDACRYAGAVLIVEADRVHGVVVRAADRDRASEAPLREGRLRLPAGGSAFHTLDDAMQSMALVRARYLRRGWIDLDVHVEPCTAPLHIQRRENTP